MKIAATSSPERRWTIRVTVIHGTGDSIIPFVQGRELFGLAPEPKRFVAVEGADHNDLIAVLGLDEYRRLLTSMIESGTRR